ncbi:MAG: hypothetical protein AAGE76_09015 [Pseudomonadota bacterium]
MYKIPEPVQTYQSAKLRHVIADPNPRRRDAARGTAALRYIAPSLWCVSLITLAYVAAERLFMV